MMEGPTGVSEYFPLGPSRPSKECFQPLRPTGVAASRPHFMLIDSYEGLIVGL
jgi:hypothetical protein